MKVFLSVPLVAALSITRFVFPELLGKLCSWKAKGFPVEQHWIYTMYFGQQLFWQGEGVKWASPYDTQAMFCGGPSRGLLVASIQHNLLLQLWSSQAATLACWLQTWVFNLLQSPIILLDLLPLHIFSSLFHWPLFFCVSHTCFQFYSAKPKPSSLKSLCLRLVEHMQFSCFSFSPQKPYNLPRLWRWQKLNWTHKAIPCSLKSQF